MKVKIKPHTYDFFKKREINSKDRFEVLEESEHFCVISNGYGTHVIRKEDIERTYSLK